MDAQDSAIESCFLQVVIDIVTKKIIVFFSVDVLVVLLSYFLTFKIVVVVEASRFCGEAFFIVINHKLTKLEALCVNGTKLTSQK